MSASPAFPRTSRSLSISGPAGRIEGLLETLDGMPPAAAVVCHPHPLHGGNMHNKVVYRAAKGMVAAGLPTLRFNFRGVGASEGHHDGGRGERGDVAAALDFLAGRYPGVPLVLAGFSFGSSVGLRVGAEDERVSAQIGLGLPTCRDDFEFLTGDPRPLLLLLGELDPFARVADLKSLAALRPAATELVIYPGEGHFFDGVLEDLAEQVAGFCRRRVGAAA